MISKGYHYVINLDIFSNFLYQYRQDLWRRELSILTFDKESVVADELGGIWVLLSP